MNHPVSICAIALSLVPASGSGPAPAPAEEIVIYAAASLRDALESMAPACERAAGVKLVFNFGASNDLARQIEAANKADVFFSADEPWMDRLAGAGLVDAESRRAPLSNRLVVVGAPDRPGRIDSASDLARAPARFISMADPDAVPAGRYARQWLQRQGQWEAILPRVLPGVDARAALAAVESGAADLGVVYATDAALSARVRVLYAVPEAEGPRIRYTIAAMRDRPRLDAARRVVAWIAGQEAGLRFSRLGFIPMEAR